jgi:aldehyde:ferredoxin oxidoreductase
MMPHGRHGAYLRIDLGSGDAEAVPIPESVARDTIGGVGLGTWIALAEGGAEYPPLAPEAPLVFCLSPLVGSPFTTSAKFAVVARSPLTGYLSDALSSSHFALAAKRAGYDAYVLVGRARGLSHLVVDDGAVELRDAQPWAGRPAAACTLPGFRTAAIGPAGERGVRFANISNDGRHAGRGGLGAIMGSKQLKAFSVRGSQSPALAHPAKAARLARELAVRSQGPATAKYRELGTVANLLAFDRLGVLPTRNFRSSRFEGAQRLGDEQLHAHAHQGSESCASCNIGCEHRFAGRSGKPRRLEYETLFALGPLLGIDDPDHVLELAGHCDRLGLDTISAGGTLAFAMEAGVAGLRFGDARASAAALGDIAARRGAGDLLAEGSRRAAEVLGCPELAMQVKGLEIPGYDPRAMHAMALGYAVGSRGADHNRSSAYQLDLSTEVNRLELHPRDSKKLVDVEDRAAWLDSLILCKFLRGIFHDLPGETAELLEAVTGERVEPLEVGARVCTLRKMFNIRAGWRPADDTLPQRLLTGALSRNRLDSCIRSYYEARGWSEEGWVPARTSRALGLGELSCPSPAS